MVHIRVLRRVWLIFAKGNSLRGMNRAVIDRSWVLPCYFLPVWKPQRLRRDRYQPSNCRREESGSWNQVITWKFILYSPRWVLFYCFAAFLGREKNNNKIHPKGNCMWKSPHYNLEVINFKMQKSAGLVFRIFTVTWTCLHGTQVYLGCCPCMDLLLNMYSFWCFGR